jgi:hypothetical protein
LLTLLVTTSELRAQAPEPLVVQVRRSIDNGVAFLKSRQNKDGGYDRDVTVPGGETGLTVVALLVAGIPAKDPSVSKALQFLRELKSDQTYIVSLQTMALAEAKCPGPGDKELLQKHVNWLLKARVLNGSRLEGWNYSNKGPTSTDGSNTQYALLALWSARQAGAGVPPIVWEEIRNMYLTTQRRDGSWKYSYTSGTLGDAVSTPMTMTTAGVSGLLIANSELNAGREIFKGPTDPATNCGEYEENKALELGIGFIKTHFAIPLPAPSPRDFYHLYGLERVGRLSGQRFFGQYDWYREGSKFLVRTQQADGSWYSKQPVGGGWDRWPIVSTSFALLFLSKGKTPVLMSKLVHGSWPREELDLDWNNDRNDLKNLVAHASKEIFRREPLAWQTVDLMMAAQPPGRRTTPTDDDLAAVTSDLLQSPILYITGHRRPKLTATERNLLKRYVDNGGFIVAEACCSSPDFDRGFRDVVAEIWPDFQLAELPAEHPVWTSPTTVAPGQPYKLWGLNQGCKTVLIYSPQDLSCRWESGKVDDPRCIQAFRLGLNLIAYATGMQKPQERLTPVAVQHDRPDPPEIPRGFFKAVQLRHGGDWRPAPRAMRNLMEDLHDVAGLDVVLKTEERPLGDPGILDFKFVYMHGRSKFEVNRDDLKDLRFNLKTGALLFADACCGREEFDASFRKFVGELLPGMKLEPVPATDALFAKALGGEALSASTIKCRTTIGGELKGMTPQLEGIRHEGRWIVLYSKYDIGCALERHQSPDCRGYDPASARKIARAAALYALSP